MIFENPSFYFMVKIGFHFFSPKCDFWTSVHYRLHFVSNTSSLASWLEEKAICKYTTQSFLDFLTDLYLTLDTLYPSIWQMRRQLCTLRINVSVFLKYSKNIWIFAHNQKWKFYKKIVNCIWCKNWLFLDAKSLKNSRKSY